jgi:hypothetical protein
LQKKKEKERVITKVLVIIGFITLIASIAAANKKTTDYRYDQCSYESQSV